MATLQYNDVGLFTASTPSAGVKTLNYQMTPVMSEDGVDHLYDHLLIEALCTWSPNTVGRPNQLGISLKGLEQALMAPRKHLIFQIGPNKVIDIDADSDASGKGPNPLTARVMSISGDKTAIVLFRIEVWLSGYDNIVISNRWTQTSHVNEHHYTTLTTTGRVTVRPDLLNTFPFFIDQFRRTFVFPMPAQNFQRVSVEVTATSDEREAIWNVVDQERGLQLGAASRITKVSGFVTGGSESQFRTYHEIVAKAAEPAGLGWEFLAGGLGALAMIGAAAKGLGNFALSAVPVVKANAIVQVWGDINSNNAELAAVAVNAAFDRLNGPNFFKFVSAYLTQAIDERYVEFRCEVLPTVEAQGDAVFVPTKFDNFMRLGGVIDVSPAPAVQGNRLSPQGDTNPPLPASVNTRGSYLGTLLAQTLTPDGNLPAVPEETFAGDIVGYT